ncbi:MAG: DUF814 domain-containing protein [Candidatus Eremiobacteraeota bacterium]|nr:DUF814 domain-containing protein [Candidatus Eremiobacteraeota bacterium]MBC5827907.1 DUF814 domain-containing protein [Candidatus Eremiobacteraeota bacterium]
MRCKGVKIDEPFVGGWRGCGPVVLDSWMVDRLARELNRSLAGARIRSFQGHALDITLLCYRRREATALSGLLSPTGPLLALRETAETSGTPEGRGWAGGIAPLLRDCAIDAITAVPNDRIIHVDVRSRSAFGVPSRHRVVFELEPRKPNVLVLRPAEDGGWAILAAAKQIRGGSGSRDVIVGETYEPPPQPRQRFDLIQFENLAAALADADERTLSRLLSDFDPTCTPPLARACIRRATEQPGGALATRLLTAWNRLRSEVAAACADTSKPVYVYRLDARTIAHCVPLGWPSAAPSMVATLNELCARELTASRERSSVPAMSGRRSKLAKMIERARLERESLERAQREAAAAEEFRNAGDLIYANLAAIEPASDSFISADGECVALDPALSPKENAAQYFRRFRKARRGLPQIAARLQTLAENMNYFEQLAWEVQRAVDLPSQERAAVLAEVDAATGAQAKTEAPRTPHAQTQGSSRHAFTIEGAVVHVGRSPQDNDRLTFRVAGPEDYWFHARGIPGAHVILKLSERHRRPSESQILVAAELAAGHSRAANAAKVEVDYTQRKHVRRRGMGKPGLVWYGHFATVAVAPRKERPDAVS